MARKNKYTQIKPKVSPLTYVLVGLVFVGLLLTIVLSIDTPREKFVKRFDLENKNIFELISLSKLEDKIEKGEELIVVVGLAKNTLTPASVIKELTVVYDVDNTRYSEIDIEKLPSKIYYLEVSGIDKLGEFVEKYEITLTNQDPMMLGFNEGALIAEYNGTKDHGVVAQDPETANLIRNVKEFFVKFNEQE